MDRAIPFWFRAVQFGKTFVHGQRLAFFWPVRAHNPNGSTIGSVIFAQITAECPYTLQWATPFPLKIAPSNGGSPIWTPSNTWFPGRDHPSPQPKRHLDRFSRFCRAH